MLDTNTPLLELDNLLSTIQESEASDLSTLELIQETNKNIRVFDQQSLPYKSLSEYASLLYTSVQTIRHSFQYFQFPLSQFKSLFSEVLVHSSKEVKVSDNLMAINAHVLYLKHQLLSAVSNALKVMMFDLLLMKYTIMCIRSQCIYMYVYVHAYTCTYMLALYFLCRYICLRGTNSYYCYWWVWRP